MVTVLVCLLVSVVAGNVVVWFPSLVVYVFRRRRWNSNSEMSQAKPRFDGCSSCLLFGFHYVSIKFPLRFRGAPRFSFLMSATFPLRFLYVFGTLFMVSVFGVLMVSVVAGNLFVWFPCLVVLMVSVLPQHQLCQIMETIKKRQKKQ